MVKETCSLTCGRRKALRYSQIRSAYAHVDPRALARNAISEPWGSCSRVHESRDKIFVGARRLWGSNALYVLMFRAWDHSTFFHTLRRHRVSSEH